MKRIIIFLAIIIPSLLTHSQPVLNAGSIGEDQDICYSTAAANLICTPTGGTPPYYFQWQRLNTGSSTWSNIYTRTNQSTFSPPLLLSATRFRVRVTDSSSEEDLSDEVIITVLPNLTSGTIGYDEEVCDGFSPSLITQVSPPSGGNGSSYIFQWQSSEDGYTWSNIEGAVEDSYLPITISQDAWYRRLVTDNLCGTKSSDYIKKTFQEISFIARDSLYRNEIPENYHNNSLVELGSEFEILTEGLITKAKLYSAPEEGGEHIIRLWKFNGSEYVLYAGPFSWTFSSGIYYWREYELPVPVFVNPGTYIISISTSVDQYQCYNSNMTNLTRNSVRFIRGLYSDVIGTVPDTPYQTSSFFRDIVFVIDNNGNLTPGLIGNSQSICYNSVPAALLELSAPSGGDAGNYSFQWQSSTDNINWTDIADENAEDLSLPALTENTYFRRYVQSGSYCPVFSNTVLISISSPPGTVAQLHDDITIYN
ncbi:MAG: DUF4082 domain-containing protein, partial [Bacteroidales bacterium]|nr:DUF4082 domain-containing protein [Bacteroidales bacterium]